MGYFPTGSHRQHDRVRLLEDGVRYIRRSARRNWIFDHRLEHVGRDDYLSTRLNALITVRRWMIGFFHRFDAKSPRAIDRIALFHDVVDHANGMLIFDFGNDSRLTAQLAKNPSEGLNVRSLTAKA
jgi:hypothetical protein